MSIVKKTLGNVQSRFHKTVYDSNTFSGKIKKWNSLFETYLGIYDNTCQMFGGVMTWMDLYALIGMICCHIVQTGCVECAGTAQKHASAQIRGSS